MILTVAYVLVGFFGLFSGLGCAVGFVERDVSERGFWACAGGSAIGFTVAFCCAWALDGRLA